MWRFQKSKKAFQFVYEVIIVAVERFYWSFTVFTHWEFILVSEGVLVISGLILLAEEVPVV